MKIQRISFNQFRELVKDYRPEDEHVLIPFDNEALHLLADSFIVNKYVTSAHRYERERMQELIEKLSKYMPDSYYRCRWQLLIEANPNRPLKLDELSLLTEFVSVIGEGALALRLDESVNSLRITLLIFEL